MSNTEKESNQIKSNIISPNKELRTIITKFLQEWTWHKPSIWQSASLTKSNATQLMRIRTWYGKVRGLVAVSPINVMILAIGNFWILKQRGARCWQSKRFRQDADCYESRGRGKCCEWWTFGFEHRITELRGKGFIIFAHRGVKLMSGEGISPPPQRTSCTWELEMEGRRREGNRKQVLVVALAWCFFTPAAEKKNAR